MKTNFSSINFLLNPLCFSENLEVIQNLIIKILTLKKGQEKRKV